MLLQWTQNQSGLNVSTKMELFLFTYTQINSKKSDQQNNTGAFSSLLAKNTVWQWEKHFSVHQRKQERVKKNEGL